ncbi:Plasma membrane fusion protein PRM1 [Psilocybe cubensis]|uniref:Plasma membrane fusion protein PRM1 n=2 Tax=Psilocybe cubensis TaxID=181762 RepID=A0A8H8CPG6_PSICU|nr:Plasma membrane fusion protein PRM1 [Psilocybe cubensis]KAH9485549.1 Plasma membrane fusion protein PRM1 [Psilocybe cubensis]
MSANWNAPPPTYDAHSSSTTLTPYLQLSHLLSLTWLAYPILSLIFVAFRLQLSLADAQNAVAGAKDDLLASCKAAEQAATSASSMPRFMAIATNKQFADAVNGSANAARATLVLALTVMEAIINFIVDIYRSTFLCFLELVVRGGLAILIGAVNELNDLIGTVTNGLRTSIQNDISTANNVIKSAIDAINKVNPFGDIKAPQITVPSLDGLQNVSLPSSFTDSLTKLNASLPSISDLKDKVESIIDTPFELLKKDINDTFAGINFQPDGLPVPELSTIKFCDNLDTSVIDDIGRDFIKTAKIGVVVLVLLALLLIGLNCLLTWYKWRCMRNHLQYTREAWISDPTMVHAKPTSSSPQITMSDHNLMMLNANSEHPLITRITNQISARFRLTPAQHTHTQWFFNYIFHAPALACFLIGFFGLLSVQIQLMAIGPLVSKYQARSQSTVSDFSSIIATSINDSMYNQSSLYANEVNGQVASIQSTINDGLFGWVNGTTTTLNATINGFYDDIQNTVTTIFGGTILESPVNEFLKCFIGGKVDAIESALTFLHDNLKIDMPRVNQTALVLSPDSVNEAAQPIAAAAIGGGTDADGNDDGGLLIRLVNSYAASLRKERVMFAIFMGLWGIVILMGLSVVLWHSVIRPMREKRSRRKWEAEQRVGLENIGPYPAGSGNEKDGNGNGGVFARSFSPLPSPRGSAFKPFWGSRSNSPAGQRVPQLSPDASQESLPRGQEASALASSEEFGAHLPPAQMERKQTGAAKLLAVGKKAVRRERLKKDGTEEELAVPLSPTLVHEPNRRANDNDTNAPWYTRIAALLSGKKQGNGDNDSSRSSGSDYWDPTAMVQADKTQDKPKLQVYTQRGIDKYGPPPPQRYQTHTWTPPNQVRAPSPPQPQTQTRGRRQSAAISWPPSPPVTHADWTRVMAPATPPQVNVSQQPAISSVAEFNFPPPPIGVPIINRERQQVVSVPNDVGPVYEDSVARAPPHVATTPILPVPLYTSFENQTQQSQQQRTPRPHPTFPQLEVAGRRRKGSSPPPPLKSPRMLQPQFALSPPPLQDKHRRASSTGTAWRVTNFVPGDATSSAHTSTASLAAMALAPKVYAGQQSKEDITTASSNLTRLLTAPRQGHARQSSSINPFITPFDDEHRVQVVDDPGAADLRKSMQTNPFVHAI